MSSRVPVNETMIKAARELLKGPSAYRDRLRGIVSGKVKNVDIRWWRDAHGVSPRQRDAKQEKEFKTKLDKIRAMADPARNPNESERRAAEAALAKAEAAGPPEAPHKSAPGLEGHDRRMAKLQAQAAAAFDAALARMRKTRPDRKPDRASAMLGSPAKPVNTTKPRPAAKSVNTTKAKAKPERVDATAKKPRSADRHLEPNRDRHRPGYMAEYMRRRRAAGNARLERSGKEKV